ncbi:MAG: YCF48-related protein, partial [Ignavibacteriaceae bacterium]
MINKIILIFFFIPILIYSQTDSIEIKIKPDYRNRKNLPQYDKTLLPLQKVNSSTGSWTELNPKVPRVDYIGIHFVNRDTGWAVGANGAIIKTIDGGRNWKTVNSPVLSTFLKIISFNGEVVIITGYDGLILRSTDSGETFAQVTSGIGNGADLWGAQMINDTIGWICGLNNVLLKTTNAGLSWNLQTTSLNTNYWWIDFLNESYGFIACDGGVVLRTTNGGISWEEYQAGNDWALYVIDIIDSLHIAAAGANGKNVYSSDGGKNWTENFRLIFDNVNSIAYVDTNTGYAIGADWGIRKTTDRGVTWFASNSNIGEWQIELLVGFYGYIAGGGLKIYKTEGTYDNWKKLFLNDNFNDVAFINEELGFLLSGNLYKTIDGGRNWLLKTDAPGGNRIIFTDSLNGVIGGINSNSGNSLTAIWKTSNGGEIWQLSNITGLDDSTGKINKIFFINTSTGWAVKNRGGILKTADAGANWFAQLNTFDFISFQSIHFSDSLNGWTANLPWKPHKTTDGGNNWIQQTEIDFQQTKDVFFKNNTEGWLMESFSLHHTTDSGNTWYPENELTGYHYSFQFFAEPDHWMIYGENIYETFDGGETWHDITLSIPATFNNFYSPSEGIGYAVGNLGLILKYIDSSVVPVELVDFSAESNDNKIQLKWATATELNNHGFEIQRENSQHDWITVGFVEGSGTTTEKKNYSFIDSFPYDGENIYRLKQIDYNGNYEYSSLVKIYNNIISEFQLFQNYPNPFNPTTTISYNLPRKSDIELKIYDILGNEIRSFFISSQS